MSNKVLVTKEFHRRALAAIEFKNKHDALNDDNAETVRMAWMSYMETHCTQEQIEHFSLYIEEYVKEFGIEFK